VEANGGEYVMKKAHFIVFLVLAVMLTPALVFAASPWTEKTTYGDKITGKLEFGLKNLFGGWTTIFSEPTRYHKDGKNVLAGVGVGLYKSVVYTVGGAVHVVTFPIPVDVPLPDNGVSFE
jgi:hypothetical protein